MALRPASTVTLRRVPNRHVGAFGQERDHQIGGVFRPVGAVAVRHHIDVGIDVGEHAADHMALALAAFAVDFGTGKGCSPRRAVGRIVVIDEDARIRQR